MLVVRDMQRLIICIQWAARAAQGGRPALDANEKTQISCKYLLSPVEGYMHEFMSSIHETRKKKQTN